VCTGCFAPTSEPNPCLPRRTPPGYSPIFSLHEAQQYPGALVAAGCAGKVHSQGGRAGGGKIKQLISRLRVRNDAAYISGYVWTWGKQQPCVDSYVGLLPATTLCGR
jgi:hypothetical protein